MAVVEGLVVALVALAIAPGRAFYFDVTPKSLALLAGTAVLVILAARRKELPPAPRLFTALLLPMAASLALSTAFSLHRSLSLYGSSWRGLGAVAQGAILLFAWLAAREANARIVLWAVAISAVPAAAFGTMGDSRSLAVWLAMSVFLSLALARAETRRLWRVAARAASAFSFAALIVICVRDAPWRGDQLQLWRDTVSMAAQRPLAGYGPEVFLGEFPHYESRALARAYPDAIYESPHNAFLDILAAQGVPGLLLLCVLCAAGLVSAWKRKDVWIEAALAAGIVGLQFAPFFMPTALLFFTTAALAVQLEKPAESRPSPVFAAVAPFLVLACLYVVLRLAMADRELVVTRHLLDAHDLRAATAEYEVYWFWRLPGASADIWYSRSWLEVAQLADNSSVRDQAVTIAEQAAWRATENAEEPFLAWYNLAEVAIFEGDAAGAERDLRLAISAHPNWYLPHRLLARQLLRQARLAEAQKEAALAAGLAGGNARKAPPDAH